MSDTPVPYPTVTYQKAHFGVSGASVSLAMAYPPQAMLDAELVIDDGQGNVT